VRELELAVLDTSRAEGTFELLGQPIRMRVLMIPEMWPRESVHELEMEQWIGSSICVSERMEEVWKSTTSWHP
jgi:hypothetical protein